MGRFNFMPILCLRPLSKTHNLHHPSKSTLRTGQTRRAGLFCHNDFGYPHRLIFTTKYLGNPDRHLLL